MCENRTMSKLLPNIGEKYKSDKIFNFLKLGGYKISKNSLDAKFMLWTKGLTLKYASFPYMVMLDYFDR